MFLHEAFGRVLASTIPLPELRSADAGPPHWRFRVVEQLPPAEGARLLGDEPIYGTVSARLLRHDSGYRIEIDDTGTFDLAPDGREIAWLPTDDPWWDFGRAHLIGRVLATSMQLEGTLTLHASAVQMADGVVGFLAPKHFGKSTLGMMLYRAGAAFVTDDSLPVDAGDGEEVRARPGIQSLRVRPGDDGAERLLGRPVDVEPGRDGKIFLPPFPRERTLEKPARLSALYFLHPFAPTDGEESVSRRRMPDIAAAIRLMGETKIGSMLGSGFAPELLETVTSIARRVPVYELSVVRDLDRLPAVVARLVEWHGLAAAPAETVAAEP